MNKFLITLFALCAVAVPSNSLAADEANLSVTTLRCSSYKGSWDESDKVKSWRSTATVRCHLVDGVGATCTLTIPEQTWKFNEGSFKEHDDGGVIAEVYDTNGRTLQMICDSYTHCLGFRVFNKDTKVGMACIP
jgi:hypothetical protein